MTGMSIHGQGTPGGPRKPKTTPPEETSEEAAYLKSLGEKQKPVSIKLADGEIVQGWIEYYDKNMLRLTRAGAVVMPAAPGFYHRPVLIDDLVNFMVGRVLDHFGVPQQLVPRWGGQDLDE